MHLMHHMKPVHNSSGFNTLLHAVGGRECCIIELPTPSEVMHLFITAQNVRRRIYKLCL